MSATLLLALLAGLQAAQAAHGDLSCLVDEIQHVSETVITNHTETLRSEIKHEVDSRIRELEEHVQYLRELSVKCCGASPKFSKHSQKDSSRPGEIRRIACNDNGGNGGNSDNSDNSDNGHDDDNGDDDDDDDNGGNGYDHVADGVNMMIGIHDDNQFTDLDTIKCASYGDIRVGEGHDIDVNQQSDEFQGCAGNQVVTAFGGTTVWMEAISHITCSEISGATVSNHCHDITITADKSGPYLEADVEWPVQCPSAAPYANVMVGVFYNPTMSPRWLGIRCCYLKRTFPEGPFHTKSHTNGQC